MQALCADEELASLSDNPCVGYEKLVTWPQALHLNGKLYFFSACLLLTLANRLQLR